MAMDWAGLASGANDGLQQILAQQIQEREMRRQAALDAEKQRQFDSAQQQEREMAALAQEHNRVKLDQDARQFSARMALDTRNLELEAERNRIAQDEFRANANLRGLQLMQAERALMPEELGREHAERLAEIEAQGRNARAVAGINTEGRSRARMTMTPGQEISTINELSRAYRTNTSGARTVDDASRNLQMAMESLQKGGNRNAASQAILIGFQKILDPTSVVRESEYARGQEGQPLLARMEGAMQRLQAGGQGVTSEELQGFVALAETFAHGYKANASREASRVRAIAEAYGLPPEWILGEDTLAGAAASPASTAAPSGPTSAAPMVTIRNQRTGETIQVPADDPRVKRR